MCAPGQKLFVVRTGGVYQPAQDRIHIRRSENVVQNSHHVAVLLVCLVGHVPIKGLQASQQYSSQPGVTWHAVTWQCW